MSSFEDNFKSLSTGPILILDPNIPLEKYVKLDLSDGNPDLNQKDITDFNVCQSYIDAVFTQKGGKVAYGGYLERRNLYNDKASFSSDGLIQRNIHLGIDYWCTAGTAIITPIAGTVHSFKNNAVKGDYGPTIILEHALEGVSFYSLYGHLSVESLEGLYIGRQFKKGEVLARLGTPDINVNYAPHLHFQIIKDLQGAFGDYPGVCSAETFKHYVQNCPDPNFLLKIEQ